MKPPTLIIEIYTDGSCHTQMKLGAWAAILLIDGKKITLSGIIKNTTHQRMELIAVMEALKYLKDNALVNASLKIVSDSQYVIGLAERKEKLIAAGFLTKALEPITNINLVKEFYELNQPFKIQFEKIKAHQKKNSVRNFNIDVDKLSRKLVREAVGKL